MEKKCRKCKQEKEIENFPKMNMGKYGVGSTCYTCISNGVTQKEIKRTPLKQSFNTIASISKTNKNTPAAFSQQTKDIIKARDKVCIISGDEIEEYHHAYFGPHHANKGPTRNNPDQGVGLSAQVHRIIHHASPKEVYLAKIYRATCIVYLQELK